MKQDISILTSLLRSLCIAQKKDISNCALSLIAECRITCGVDLLDPVNVNRNNPEITIRIRDALKVVNNNNSPFETMRIIFPSSLKLLFYTLKAANYKNLRLDIEEMWASLYHGISLQDGIKPMQPIYRDI